MRRLRSRSYQLLTSSLDLIYDHEVAGASRVCVASSAAEVATDYVRLDFFVESVRRSIVTSCHVVCCAGAENYMYAKTTLFTPNKRSIYATKSAISFSMYAKIKLENEERVRVGAICVPIQERVGAICVPIQDFLEWPWTRRLRLSVLVQH